MKSSIWLGTLIAAISLGLFGTACAPAATAVPPAAPAASGAVSGDVVLAITGAVDKEQKWPLSTLKAMPAITLTTDHPKSGKQTYNGVKLNGLLDQAQIKPTATVLTFVAVDTFAAEASLADVRKCGDCLMAFNTQGRLDAAMPGFASGIWVRDVVRIEIK